MVKGIYVITNRINKKIYIGQTTNLKIRWKSHLCLLRKNQHRNIHLQSSFNKYGEESFKFSILEKCDNTDERECYWIEFYGGIHSKKIYNQSSGGKGGGKRSKEVREAISKWQTGRKLTKEHRDNISKGNIGKKHTEDHKKYISDLYKGRPLDEDTKRKISAAKKGVKLSAATKEKLKDKGNVSICQYDLTGQLIKEFKSAKQAGEELGFWKSDITQNCLNKRKTVKGFVFKYKT